jgi:hypothetical protein
MHDWGTALGRGVIFGWKTAPFGTTNTSGKRAADGGPSRSIEYQHAAANERHGPLPTASYPDRSTTYPTASQIPRSRASALISGR